MYGVKLHETIWQQSKQQNQDKWSNKVVVETIISMLILQDIQLRSCDYLPDLHLNTN